MDAASQIVLGSLSGLSLTKEEERFFTVEKPLGITLFSRNLVENDPYSPYELCRTLRSLTGEAPLIAIDQEGGRVARLRNLTNLGPALQIGQGQTTSDVLQQIFDYAKEVAAYFRAVGVGINFAPVVDIFEEGIDPSIGDRCFAKTPQDVILRAGAYLRGLEESHVAGCLKHFPGLGRSRSDTHFGSDTIHRSMEELNDWDLIPYTKLCAEASMVMLSHAVYPLISTNEASCSATFVDILRTQFNFQGIVVGDDITMKAIPQTPHKRNEYVIASISAGVDMILVCQNLQIWQETLTMIRQQMRKSRFFEQRVEDSAERILDLKEKLGLGRTNKARMVSKAPIETSI